MGEIMQGENLTIAIHMSLGTGKKPVINSLSFSDKVMPNIFRTLVVV